MTKKIKQEDCYACMLKYDHELQQIGSKVTEMHKIIMGNGRPGLWEEFNQLKGGLTLARLIAFSSLGASLSALVIQFI